MATTNKNAEDIISKSGNNFHYQVVSFFRSKGWVVLVSPFYNDNLTDKPREIDIVAEKEFTINSIGGSGWLGTLNVKLFIECKYINREIVFWFDTVNKESLVDRIVQDTSLEPPEANIAIEKHRYMTLDSVAKLFASKPDKSQENEIIYKALNQSLNAMVYYRNSPSIIPAEEYKRVQILLTINYPLIICNDFSYFFRVNGDAGEPSKIMENFLLEINYAYNSKDKRNINEYFLVDIVDFSKLDILLKEIEEKDVNIIKRQLSWRHRQ